MFCSAKAAKYIRNRSLLDFAASDTNMSSKNWTLTDKFTKPANDTSKCESKALFMSRAVFPTRPTAGQTTGSSSDLPGQCSVPWVMKVETSWCVCLFFFNVGKSTGDDTLSSVSSNRSSNIAGSDLSALRLLSEVFWSCNETSQTASRSSCTWVVLLSNASAMHRVLRAFGSARLFLEPVMRTPRAALFLQAPRVSDRVPSFTLTEQTPQP